MIHFTEQDFRGLQALYAGFNARWAAELMFCVYPAREANRERVLTVRGSAKAPSEPR